VIGKVRAGAMLERDHAKKTQRCALCHRAPLNASGTHTSRTVPARQILAERTLEDASPLTR